MGIALDVFARNCRLLSRCASQSSTVAQIAYAVCGDVNACHLEGRANRIVEKNLLQSFSNLRPSDGLIYSVFKDRSIEDITKLRNSAVQIAGSNSACRFLEHGEKLVKNKETLTKDLVTRVRNAWKDLHSPEEIYHSVFELAHLSPKYGDVFKAFENVDLSFLQVFKSSVELPALVSDLLIRVEKIASVRRALLLRIAERTIEHGEAISSNSNELDAIKIRLEKLRSESEQLAEREKQLRQREERARSSSRRVLQDLSNQKLKKQVAVAAAVVSVVVVVATVLSPKFRSGLSTGACALANKSKEWIKSLPSAIKSLFKASVTSLATGGKS